MSWDKTAELLFDAAKRLGFKPQRITEYGGFAISVQGKQLYFFDTKSYLNSHMSSYIAKNKHFARVVLEQHGLPNIPFVLPHNLAEAKTFLHQHGKIVIKPTMGTGSEDVHLVTSEKSLTKFELSNMILEKYIAGRELRYLVLEGKIIAVQERHFPGLINNPLLVKRVAYPETQWDQNLISISLRAAEATYMQFGAVDFKVDNKGTPYILEVNSAPGLEWFHYPSEGPVVDVARMLLEATVRFMKVPQL